MPRQGVSLTSLEDHSSQDVSDEWEKANITHNFEQGWKESW